MRKKKQKPIIFLVVDLFCGAGGTTEGMESATDERGNKIAKVIVGVNHDAGAIASHAANHPETIHFVEDVRKVNIHLIQSIVRHYRRVYKRKGYKVILLLHASLECANFSNAKGGKAKNPDSRTLAEHMNLYVDILRPDYFTVENVREFMSWGPLDDKFKPISREKGIDYERWIREIEAYGMKFDKRLLNAADFGANTSRLRFFGVFAKKEFKQRGAYDLAKHLPILFPEPTHAKNPAKSGYKLKKHQPVKDCLDFQDKGTSIFGRKKPLVDKSLERIYRGLTKYGTDDKSKIEDANFFIAKYYGNGDNTASINDASGTVTVKDRFLLVNSPALPALPENYYIVMEYSSGQTDRSIHDVSGAIMVKPKNKLVTLSYLLNPQWGGNTWDINKPCFTLIARMDKAPPYLINLDQGTSFTLNVTGFFDDLDFQYLQDESNNTFGPRLQKSVRIKIVEFMAAFGITDIKIRTLKVLELLLIQGFPGGYILKGNSSDQKKFIGNSVPPVMGKVLTESLHEGLVYGLEPRLKIFA